MSKENEHYLKVLYDESSIFQPEIREAIKFALNERKRVAELKKRIKADMLDEASEPLFSKEERNNVNLGLKRALRIIDEEMGK